MNRVELIGRLTADPELRYTQTNKAYTRFCIAVNRNFKNENGEVDADFINVVAWDKKAELICQYVKKGHRLGVSGRIQTGSFEKQDGSRGYLTDIIVEHHEFLESKSRDNTPAPEYTDEFPNEEDDPFQDFGNDIQISDEELPF